MIGWVLKDGVCYSTPRLHLSFLRELVIVEGIAHLISSHVEIPKYSQVEQHVLSDLIVSSLGYLQPLLPQL
jgi:hypothetical protein